MALAMARRLKHPKSGIFWLRKREKFSLITRDPAEAKRLSACNQSRFNPVVGR